MKVVSEFCSPEKLYTAPFRDHFIPVTRSLIRNIICFWWSCAVIYTYKKKGMEREHDTTRPLWKSFKHLKWGNHEPMSFCLYKPKIFLIASLWKLTTTLESSLFHLPQMPLTFISCVLNISLFCIISGYVNTKSKLRS